MRLRSCRGSLSFFFGTTHTALCNTERSSLRRCSLSKACQCVYLEIVFVYTANSNLYICSVKESKIKYYGVSLCQSSSGLGNALVVGVGERAEVRES